MKPNVSIIIPVYNSEKYISKCLDSLINQTYKDYELLIVNDGSTDNSQNIINEYKNKYPEIIVLKEQENLGVAVTRNNAIEEAKGKYIMFIDNDDFVDKDYVETFVKEIEKNDYDVILGGYRRPNKEGKIVKELKLPQEDWAKFMIFAPWARIYKREYLIKNDIKFLHVNIGEDVFFNIQAMLISDKIKIIDYIGYNWFYNEQSVSNTKQKNINNLQIYKLLNSCYDILLKKNILEKHYEIIEMYFIRYIVWFLLFSTKKVKYETIKLEYTKIFNWLKERFPNYRNNQLIGMFTPKGEILSVRLTVYIFMKMEKLHLGKLFLGIYSKI